MKPRVVFFSAAEISLPCLEVLQKDSSVTLAGVVTQPERERGRGKKVSLNPIARWAVEHRLPYLPVETMDDSALGAFRDLKPDLVFVMAFGHILKKAFLSYPRLGMWNFHTSLLPKYRGASPIQTCLLQGDTESGVTLMSMVEKMDAGPWLAQKRCPVDPGETTGSLTEKLSHCAAQLLQENLPSILEQRYTLVPQEESAVSYCKKFSKADGLLDFQQPAAVLERRIRAFQPWPNAYFFKNETRYIIHQAHVEPSVSETPGVFVKNSEGTQLAVTTSQGRLAIDRIQKAGGKMLAMAEFLRGDKNF